MTNLAQFLFAIGGPLAVTTFVDWLQFRSVLRVRWRYNLVLSLVTAILVQLLACLVLWAAQKLE